MSLSDTVVEYFSPDSRPYGLTYGQWTVKWWQWLASIPTDSNPTADETGIHAAVNQTDTISMVSRWHIWRKSVNRRCRITSAECLSYSQL